MSNLTITIDDDLLRSARVKAVQEGTSVNEVCRRAIAAYASDTGDAQAKAHAKAQAFWDFSNGLKLARSDAKKLSRDALYDAMLAEKSPPQKSR